MIFHYTTQQAVNEILKTYRQSKDKDNLTFWASSIYMMNDLTEMQYGWGVVMDILQNFEEKKGLPTEIRLSKFMKSMEKSPFAKYFEEHLYHEEKTPFVISFSDCDDSLPMWSMYGGNGSGVCLCFDGSQIIAKDDKVNAFPLESTMYVPQTNESNVSTEFWGEILIKQYQEYLEGDKNDLKKIEYIATLNSIISAYVKDASFAYEKEKRLVVWPKNTHALVQFRCSGKGNVVPYVEVPIPTGSLSKIIIGPCAEQQNVKRGLQLSLHTCGLDIPIVMSQVPYREV